MEIPNFVILLAECMIHSYKFYLFCFLFFLPIFLSAQQIISNTSHKVDYQIPYRTADGKNYVPGNQLLRELAKDVLREPWLVHIHISCELGLSIVRNGNQNQLIISFRRPAIGGDTVYRHFPVADVLFPSHINMKLRWANRADASNFTEESISNKSLREHDTLLCAIPVASFDNMVDTLMVREVVLFYDSLALRIFLDRIELIHDYYASLSLLDSLQKFTADLHQIGRAHV